LFLLLQYSFTITPDPAACKAGCSFNNNAGQVRKYLMQDPDCREISMGMSGDYKIVLEERSTMIRIGRLIFGKRI